MAGGRRGGVLGGLLRRLFGRAGSSSGEPPSRSQQDAGDRIEAARDRLKAAIPPPEDQSPGGAVPREGRPGAAGR